MTKKKVEPTKEELQAERLEKTKNYLESIGVMMPILKDARAVGTVDIVKNKDFIKFIDVFLMDHLAEATENKDLAKMISKKGTRKTLVTNFIKERLEPTINEMPNIVWDLLMTTIMVDSLPDEEGEWLDFEYTLDIACIKKYQDDLEWFNEEFGNVGTMDVICEIADYIDYVSMIVSINLFRFSRQVDEQSRYQMMGNIGGLEDIRRAVQKILLGEVFGDTKNIPWINKVLEENKDS